MPPPAPTRRPATELTLTRSATRRGSRSAARRRCGSAAWATYSRPLRLRSIIRSHSSTGASTIWPSSITPALLMTVSSRPSSCAVRSTAACACSRSVTSASIASPPISPASASSRSLRRAATATVAPCAASARAVASPIPLLAPVTSATVSRSSLLMAGRYTGRGTGNRTSVDEVTLLCSQQPPGILRGLPPHPSTPQRSCMKLPLRRPAALLAASVATLAVALPSTALAKPHAKEYSLEQFAAPADIASGPDGALYAPDGSLGRLWRITTHGKVSYQEVGSGPAGVATGRDGALWVTDRSLDQVIRVTTKGKQTPYQLPEAGSFPTDIVSGSDGALWFIEARGDRIGRITTQGLLTEYPISARAGAGEITAGPDGALWFTEAGGNAIGRITTTGAVTEYPLATPEALPGPIVAGRDGGIYFAERNTNTLVRMSTSGVVTRSTPLPEGSDPLALAFTCRGLAIAEGFAFRVDFARQDGSLRRPVATKSSPSALTIGPDGNLWYASDSFAAVGRIELD